MKRACGTLRSRVYTSVTESGRPQKQLVCVGKAVDYKRRQAGWLRGKFHLSVGRRLTKPAVLYFPCLWRGKCAASPHTAALVRISVSACMSVNYCLSHRDTTPGIGFGNGLSECPSRKSDGKLLFSAWRHHSRDRVREGVYSGARAGNKPANYCLVA